MSSARMISRRPHVLEISNPPRTVSRRSVKHLHRALRPSAVDSSRAGLRPAPVAVRLRLSLEPSSPSRAQSRAQAETEGRDISLGLAWGGFRDLGHRERAIPDRGHPGTQFPWPSTPGAPRMRKGFAPVDRRGSRERASHHIQLSMPQARACGTVRGEHTSAATDLGELSHPYKPVWPGYRVHPLTPRAPHMVTPRGFGEMGEVRVGWGKCSAITQNDTRARGARGAGSHEARKRNAKSTLGVLLWVGKSSSVGTEGSSKPGAAAPEKVAKAICPPNRSHGPFPRTTENGQRAV
jgi:hypothetical protein